MQITPKEENQLVLLISFLIKINQKLYFKNVLF
jgi:hypothetical protein